VPSCFEFEGKSYRLKDAAARLAIAVRSVTDGI
jgi:hypothetical protein